MFSRSSPHEAHQAFGTPADQALLLNNDLASFDALWSIDADWVEAPNYRRQGWSGVVRIELQDGDAPPTIVYLKRQSGHC